MNNLIDTSSTTLSAGTVIANCVPFVSSYSTSTDGIQGRTQIDIDFVAGSPPSVRATRTQTAGAVYIAIYIVEFDSSAIRVQQGTFSLPSTTSTTETLGTSVDTTKAAMVFYHRNSLNIDNWSAAAVAGWIDTTSNPSSTLNFQRNATGTSTITGHWYVFEALDNQFTVQHGNCSMGGSVTYCDVALGSAVAANKTFVISSYRSADSTADHETYNSLTTYLNGTASVRNVRGMASSSTQISDVRVAAISVDDGGYVQHKYWAPTTLATGTVSIDPVDTSTAMVWPVVNAGSPGVGAAGNNSASNAEHHNANLTVSSATEVTGTRGMGTYGATFRFEVVDWREGTFEYRRPITVKDAMTPAGCTYDPTDFPVLISLSGDWLKSRSSDPVNGRIYSTNGYDIIFRETDGKTALDHEIETYDGVNGMLVAWVRIPTLARSANTLFYMYYGNPSVGASTANPAGVWPTGSGWKGVWHLAESGNGTLNEYKDSTANAGHGTGGKGYYNAGSGYVPTRGTGKIGYGQTFDGSNDFIDMANSWWYNSSWPYRKRIIIQGSQVSGTSDLNNFPALIKFDPNTYPELKHTGYTGGHVGKTNGGDIFFTNDEGTKLDHEVERYDPATGELIAWVEVPELYWAANTTLYMYYGYASAADQQNATGVWDAEQSSVRDTFTGTNGTLLSAHNPDVGNNGSWTYVPGGSYNLNIQTNTLRLTAVPAQEAYKNSTPPPGPDYVVKADVQFNGTLSTNHRLYLLGRLNAANTQAYVVEVRATGSPNVFLNLRNPGESTLCSYTATLTAGSWNRFYLRMKGSSLTAEGGGSSCTATNSAITGAGNAAIGLTAASLTTDVIVDNFVVDTERFAAVYHLNQASTPALDSTVAPTINLAFNGGTAQTAGQIGYGLTFDGSGDYLLSTATLSTTSFTMEAWVTNNTWSGWQAIVDLDNGSGTNFRDLSIYDDIEVGSLAVANTSSSQYRISDPLSGTGWHHVVARYDYNTNSLNGFVDGVWQSSYTPSPGWGSITARVISGAVATGVSTYTDYWNGKIDEVRVCSPALTDDWIITEYNNQSSPSTFYQVVSEETPSSVTLDLTGSAVTIEAWVNFTSTSTYQGIVTKNGWADGYRLYLNNGSSTKRTIFELEGESPESASVTSSGTLSASTWHHVVATWDGSTMRQYFNGSVDANTDSKTNPLQAAGKEFWLGHADHAIEKGWSYQFNGTLDEVRICSVGRDACWIGTEYNTAYYAADTSYIEVGAEGAAAPTAVKLTSFMATQYSDGVLLRWKTGYEVRNLGFHIYREENGQLVRLTPEPVAGSALMAGSRTALGAGHHYHWWDTSAIADVQGSLTLKDRPSASRTVPQVAGLEDRKSFALSEALLERSAPQAQRSVTQYWLKDIDLSGKETMYGPVTPVISQEPIPEKFRPELLSEVGHRLQERYRDYWKARELKERLRQKSSVIGHRSSALKVASNLKGRRPAPRGNSVPDPQTQWSLAGRPAVKILVKAEGWYRVTQSELVAAGLSSKLNAHFLQLYTDGREQPIRITGKRGGKFGSQEAIEFYGVGLDTPSTDMRVYWLIEGLRPGKRVEESHSQGGGIVSSNFPYTVEKKERTLYFAALRNGEEENFFGPVIYMNEVDQILELRHLDRATTEDALLEVVLQGATETPHRVKVLLNGVEVGEVVFEGQGRGILRVEIPQSMLEEGENLVSLVAMGDDMDATLLDTIRLTYWHTSTADDNGLRFTAQGGEQRSIEGFGNSGIRVFDITDSNEVIEVTGKVVSQKGGYAISFEVPEHGERTLLALTDERAKDPMEVVSNHPSRWHQEKGGYDLVIISHRDFMDSLQPLRQLRESQGLRVALIDVEDIYDEFSFGNKSPKALRDFLSYTKTKWYKPPRFVLLVGDASFDPRNYLGLGDMDFVPTRLVDTVYMETASDDWFVDFNSDGLPEMAIGRLPVQTKEEAAIVVSKIAGYEKSSKRNEALLVADRADNSDDYNFAGASEEVRALLPAYLMVRKIFREQFSSDAQAKATLLNGINQGALLVNFIGHGSVESWRGSLLTLEDAESLINGFKLPFFVNMTCLNGYFQNPYGETLAEALIKASGGGAIAIWTSSGLTEPDKQAPMNKELIKLLFFNTNGGQSLTIGEATARAKSATSDQDVRKTWILFGDPSTRLK